MIFCDFLRTKPVLSGLKSQVVSVVLKIKTVSMTEFRGFLEKS